MESDRSAVVRGAVAGALAATVVVLFFFVVDAASGQLLGTPAFLASVLLGGEAVEPGAAMIVGYTIVHYLVFIALGIGAAWFFDRVRTPPSLLLGLVLGFLLFDIVFYAGVGLAGVDIAQQLGWPALLAGNLLAGLVLVGYLGRTSPVRPRGWRDVLREHRTLREGLVAGLIGAAAVAAWFFLLDLVLGRLFFTPGALGSALFAGIDDPALVQVTAGTVLGYTVVHLAAFLATGMVFAALVGQADEHPPVLLALALLFVTFETLVIGLIAIVAAWLLDVLPWWSIALGNLIAAAAMGVYLWKRHPDLARNIERAESPAQELAPGHSGDPASPVGGSGPRP